MNEFHLDEEYIDYLNLVISISTENFKETVILKCKRIKQEKKIWSKNIEYEASNSDINFKTTSYFVNLELNLKWKKNSL